MNRNALLSDVFLTENGDLGQDKNTKYSKSRQKARMQFNRTIQIPVRIRFFCFKWNNKDMKPIPLCSCNNILSMKKPLMLLNCYIR